MSFDPPNMMTIPFLFGVLLAAWTLGEWDSGIAMKEKPPKSLPSAGAVVLVQPNGLVHNTLSPDYVEDYGESPPEKVTVGVKNGFSGSSGGPGATESSGLTGVTTTGTGSLTPGLGA